MGHHLSSLGSCARAQFDEMIGPAKGFLVVLNDKKRVAEIAEVTEQVEKPGMIRRVKPDAGFVENVQDAGEATSELTGEAGTAGFPAGERVHGAIEGEITKSKFF